LNFWDWTNSIKNYESSVATLFLGIFNIIILTHLKSYNNVPLSTTFWGVYVIFWNCLDPILHSQIQHGQISDTLRKDNNFFTIYKQINWTGFEFFPWSLSAIDDHENSWPTPLSPIGTRNGKAPCHLQQNQTANFSSFVKLSAYKSTFTLSLSLSLTHTHTHTHTHTYTHTHTHTHTHTKK